MDFGVTREKAKANILLDRRIRSGLWVKVTFQLSGTLHAVLDVRPQFTLLWVKIESIVAISLLTVYSPISQAIIKALQMLNRSISSMLRTVMMMITINLYIRQTKAQIAISAYCIAYLCFSYPFKGTPKYVRININIFDEMTSFECHE